MRQHFDWGLWGKLVVPNGGAEFSWQRWLQPMSGLFFDLAGHRLKPMLQAKARATSHANFFNQSLAAAC